VALAQLPAHLGEERVLHRARQVVDADLRRVDLPARRAAGHHRHPGPRQKAIIATFTRTASMASIT
jgi:type II secretory pathway component PulJ